MHLDRPLVHAPIRSFALGLYTYDDVGLLADHDLLITPEKGIVVDY